MCRWPSISTSDRTKESAASATMDDKNKHMVCPLVATLYYFMFFLNIHSFPPPVLNYPPNPTSAPPLTLTQGSAFSAPPHLPPPPANLERKLVWLTKHTLLCAVHCLLRHLQNKHKLKKYYSSSFSISFFFSFFFLLWHQKKKNQNTKLSKMKETTQCPSVWLH